MVSIAIVAQAFNLNIVGNANQPIDSLQSFVDQTANSLTWARDESVLKKIKAGTVLIAKEHEKSLNAGVSALTTDENPRLVFAKIAQRFFGTSKKAEFINNVEHFKTRNDLLIGDNCHISRNVTIGKNCIIHPNVTIYSNTSIGDNCEIQSNCSIGTEGLGYERLEDGTLIEFPQLGGVEIGNNVKIGPNSTVRKGALGKTRIGSGTVVGGLCNVGHNSSIGENCLLVTQCVIGGSSVIGDNAFIGINALVKNKVHIGNNATVAMGAVVVKNVSENATVLGNPAEKIESFQKWNSIKKEQLRQK